MYFTRTHLCVGMVKLLAQLISNRNIVGSITPEYCHRHRHSSPFLYLGWLSLMANCDKCQVEKDLGGVHVEPRGELRCLLCVMANAYSRA